MKNKSLPCSNRSITSAISSSARRSAARIAEQGKLTPELEKQITESTRLQQVEDLYRPYKPKRNTRGSKAREADLEPLADILRAGVLDPLAEAVKYINEQVADVRPPCKAPWT